MIFLLSLLIAEEYTKWVCGSHILIFFSYLRANPICISNLQIIFPLIIMIMS